MFTNFFKEHPQHIKDLQHCISSSKNTSYNVDKEYHKNNNSFLFRCKNGNLVLRAESQDEQKNTRVYSIQITYNQSDTRLYISLCSFLNHKMNANLILSNFMQFLYNSNNNVFYSPMFDDYNEFRLAFGLVNLDINDIPPEHKVLFELYIEVFELIENPPTELMKSII